MTKKTPTITRKPSTRNSLKRKHSKKFYHTSEWRSHRNTKKATDRKKDVDRVLRYYEENEQISNADLSTFLSASDMPMCEQCEREGRLTPAYYLDHIKRIRAGGDKWDEKNLQWLCKECDLEKRIKESKE